VILAKTPPFRPMVDKLVAGVFEMDMKVRRRVVDATPQRYRVDFADMNEATADVSFWFTTKPVFNDGEINLGEPVGRRYLIPRYRIVDPTPADQADFHRRLNALWQYGYDRGRAALR
jgi:hypothetical protein